MYLKVKQDHIERYLAHELQKYLKYP
jgi:hypothetical protein